MGMADITFETLLGGVTQAPEPLRSGEKLADQVNCISSMVEGLRRRPHSSHIGNVTGLPAVTEGDLKFHLIDRGDERYIVTIGDQSQSGDGTMSVYDIFSGASPVNIRDKNGDPAVAADFEYLDCDDPLVDLRLRTLADITWVVNRKKTVAMKSTTSSDWTPQALFVIVTGGYSTTYTLTVDTRTVKLTTNNAKTAGNEKWVTPGYIAERMAAGLTGSPSINNSTDDASLLPSGTALVPADWVIEVHGGVVHIERVDGAEFDISTEDSFTDRAIVVKDKVAAFVELPAVAPDGFNVKVDGDDDLEGGEYYLVFEADNAGEFGPGDWTQTVAPGITTQIDPATMPHILVRLSSGEFLFTQADGSTYNSGGVVYEIPQWLDRETGDDDSNPLPSFIDTQIRDVLFVGNRFTIVTPGSTAISTEDNAYSFWRLTVRELLDTERIDLRMPHDRVVSLHSAVAIGGQLYPVGSGTQFRITGDEVLSPRTVSSAASSEFSTDQTVRPTTIGRSIFVVDRRGSFSVVRELIDPQQSQRPTLIDAGLMNDLPAFIVGQVRSMSGSDTLSMLAVTSTGDASTFYLLSLLEDPREGRRLANSWSKHTASGDIVLAEFVETDLYLLVRRGDDYALEVIDLTPFAADPGRDYAAALDRRVSVTPVAADGVNTLIELPYDPVGEVAVVSADGDSPSVVSVDGSTVSVLGEYVGEELLVGERIASSFEPSRAFVRTQSPTGGSRVTHAEWLAITSGSILLEDTGYLEIETQDGEQSYTDVFTPETLDGGVVGEVELFSGLHVFDVMAEGSLYRIVMSSDSHLPFRVLGLTLSLQWRSGRQLI